MLSFQNARQNTFKGMSGFLQKQEPRSALKVFQRTVSNFLFSTGVYQYTTVLVEKQCISTRHGHIQDFLSFHSNHHSKLLTSTTSSASITVIFKILSSHQSRKCKELLCPILSVTKVQKPYRAIISGPRALRP